MQNATADKGEHHGFRLGPDHHDVARLAVLTRHRVPGRLVERGLRRAQDRRRHPAIASTRTVPLFAPGAARAINSTVIEFVEDGRRTRTWGRPVSSRPPRCRGNRSLLFRDPDRNLDQLLHPRHPGRHRKSPADGASHSDPGTLPVRLRPQQDPRGIALPSPFTVSLCGEPRAGRRAWRWTACVIGDLGLRGCRAECRPGGLRARAASRRGAFSCGRGPAGRP